MEKMLSFIWRVLVALHPSGTDNADVQLAWRRTVAALLSAVVVIGAASLSWAQGWLPNTPGVATKADVQQVSTTLETRVQRIESSVNGINLRLVKSDIAEALTNSCTAQARGNPDALARANDELYGHDSSEGLLDQYRDIMHRPYNVPPCSEILISPKP